MNNTERMERVNALATQTKTDRALIPELWELVEQLIKVICRRYCRSDKVDRLYDHDDLCQSAYFGFLKAVDTYNPERGAFSTHLIFYIRRSCAKEIGRYGGKKEPLFMANSLDAPIPLEYEHDIALVDTLEDPSAEEAFEYVNDQVHRAELHAALDNCMERIPGDRANLLRFRFYSGATLDAIAAERGISREGARKKVEQALNNMRQSENIEHLMPFWQKEIIAQSLRYIGFEFFKNTWHSSVEWAAEQLILSEV